jgi:hypothetical protein
MCSTPSKHPVPTSHPPPPPTWAQVWHMGEGGVVYRVGLRFFDPTWSQPERSRKIWVRQHQLWQAYRPPQWGNCQRSVQMSWRTKKLFKIPLQRRRWIPRFTSCTTTVIFGIRKYPNGFKLWENEQLWTCRACATTYTRPCNNYDKFLS